MSFSLLIATGLLCYCLGAVTLSVFVWFSVNDRTGAEFQRRQAEQQLQRVSHAAMVQMLAEATRGSGRAANAP